MLKVRSLGCAVLLAGLFASQASAISWSISGPGVTSVVQNSSSTSTASYNLTPSGFALQTWSVSAIAQNNSDVTVDWNYSGFHSFFNVTAFLEADPSNTVLLNVGPANCCTSPSAGFNHSGTFTFTGLIAGQSYGFSFGGSHFDSTNSLQGTLVLREHMPEPTTAVLGLMALGGMMVRRRRMA